MIDDLESQLESIEEHLFDKNAALANIEQLYELKRKVVVLKHAVMPLMEATGKLHGGRVPPVCTTTQEYFRDVYDHLTRINATIDAMRDTITTAILVCQSTVSIEQNEVNKRLAAWAGIFAVATAFAGIWGMNFQHMPELQWDFGYPSRCSSSLQSAAFFTCASSVLTGCDFFRKKQWLTNVPIPIPCLKKCSAPKPGAAADG